jgi:hypothetical protein
MSDAETPPFDNGTTSEPAEPEMLQSVVGMDEDELAADPLEEGIEPAEHWSGVVEARPTPREQREGETLEEHLTEERPDFGDPSRKPLAETRMQELDDSIDERASAEVVDEEPLASGTPEEQALRTTREGGSGR